ncbi:MAG: acetyl-CoA carboxylase carboxyl transferase subunit alpha [Chthoniobacterales bacterium]|nr:MAG: acetyl-CoA carboxylase carboxyl transferase subunit alpha [Chthoniobacterales bacterium]
MESHPLDFEKPILELQRRLQDLKSHSDQHDLDFDTEVEAMENKIRETRRQIYDNLTAWQRVQLARHIKRPFALDYIARCFTDWVELHGDRFFGDDKAMPSGLAKLGPHRCVVVTHQKGRDTKENVMRNFGCAHPEGYRKALRLMRHAEKFGFPVITFIDTPGANPGLQSEERGMAFAIADDLLAMLTLRVPVIAVVIGEGGSGGALAIGVGDRILMLENAIYSVASPESAAAILWRTAANAPQAATAMRIRAQDAAEFGIVDRLITEPEGGAQTDVPAIVEQVRQALQEELAALEAQVRSKRKDGGIEGLLAARRAKYMRIGVFRETGAPAKARPSKPTNGHAGAAAAAPARAPARGAASAVNGAAEAPATHDQA